LGAKLEEKELYLWEILVPTMKNVYDGHIPKKPFFSIRHHRQWDKKVRAIAGGLTIYPPVKGQWISGDGRLFEERMIGVRIMCSEEEIEKIVDLTAKHYGQLAIFYYLVSTYVKIKHFPEK
jgi:hypothetical protein